MQPTKVTTKVTTKVVKGTQTKKVMKGTMRATKVMKSNETNSFSALCRRARSLPRARKWGTSHTMKMTLNSFVSLVTLYSRFIL